jgi:hypothetical protein
MRVGGEPRAGLDFVHLGARHDLALDRGDKL